jgi:peptidoglycan/xylan/chitin deacetylase (PgdA/CDA1 family)
MRRPLPAKLSIYFHSTIGREQQLDELISFLSERGYRFSGPDGFLTASGSVCFLSFDDNYRSWLQTLPILERHRVQATFYVNSWPFRDRVSEADMRHYLKPLDAPEQELTLSTTELKEISAAGHTIGSHTHTHPVLTTLPEAEALDEIRISREVLGLLLDRPVDHFAYPFGMRRHFNPKLRSYCSSIGFATIANAIPGMQFARSRPDNLHRSVWDLGKPLEFNLDNVCIDGRVFSTITDRSAAG